MNSRRFFYVGKIRQNTYRLEFSLEFLEVLLKAGAAFANFEAGGKIDVTITLLKL